MKYAFSILVIACAVAAANGCNDDLPRNYRGQGNEGKRTCPQAEGSTCTVPRIDGQGDLNFICNHGVWILSARGREPQKPEDRGNAADDDDNEGPTDPCETTTCDGDDVCSNKDGVAKCHPNPCKSISCGTNAFCEVTKEMKPECKCLDGGDPKYGCDGCIAKQVDATFRAFQHCVQNYCNNQPDAYKCTHDMIWQDLQELGDDAAEPQILNMCVDTFMEHKKKGDVFRVCKVEAAREKKIQGDVTVDPKCRDCQVTEMEGLCPYNIDQGKVSCVKEGEWEEARKKATQLCADKGRCPMAQPDAKGGNVMGIPMGMEMRMMRGGGMGMFRGVNVNQVVDRFIKKMGGKVTVAHCTAVAPRAHKHECKKADKDGDGILSRDEIRAAVREELKKHGVKIVG